MGFLKERIKDLQKRDPAKFGSLEGVKLFSRYENRSQLFIEGVHGVTEGGIHGRAGEGAFSIVVAGRYDDDDDQGDIILYTGEGGHSRTSELQVKDQEWVRGNAALRMSCTRKLPVRVIRSSVLRSKYAPSSGYRYDGLYRVVKAEKISGHQGHEVCHFTLSRLQGQAPLPGNSAHVGLGGDVEAAQPSQPSMSTSPRQSALASSQKSQRAPRRKAGGSSESGGIKFKFEGSFSPAKSEPTGSKAFSRSEGSSSSTGKQPPGFF